jgi:hypothetical protein
MLALPLLGGVFTGQYKVKRRGFAILRGEWEPERCDG